MMPFVPRLPAGVAGFESEVARAERFAKLMAEHCQKFVLAAVPLALSCE